MKTIVGVYGTHEKAIAALQKLQQSGYPTNLLSIVGKANLTDNHVFVNRVKDEVEEAEISIGAVAGTVIGILTGVGIFAIPGLGLIYGAGAFLGAITGLWGGIVTGGFAVILTTKLGINEEAAQRYEQHIKEGRVMVFAQGNDEQIEKAQKVLQAQGSSIELNIH